MSRRLVPVLIALLVVAQVTTALVGAAGIRADRRRAAAAARERKAAALYLQQLQAPVVQVFDAVQPLQDVSDALSEPGPGQLGVRIDVLTHSGAAADLVTARTALRALHSPTSYRSRAAELDRRLGDLLGDVHRLSAAAAGAARTGRSEQLDITSWALADAEADWSVALQKAYGTALPPAAPSSFRQQGPARKAATRGGYIQQSDQVCARADAQIAALPSLATPANLVRYGPRFVDIVTRALHQLERVPVPPRDAAAVQRRVGAQLHASEAVPRAVAAIAAAVRKRDLPTLEAALKQADRSFSAFDRLAKAYRGYGVSLCAASFGGAVAKGGGSLTA